MMRNVREGPSSLTPCSASSVWLLLAAFTLVIGPGSGYECGGFISMSPKSTGTIQSPGYPGNYPNYTRCIWILEAPDEFTPQLTVNFQGEMYSSSCSDYVEFRDGGQSDELILSNCATMTSQVVASTGRWMYVFFGSDGFSQVDGLSATYSAVYVGSAINKNISNPVSNCHSYEFECGNKLCLSMSYRCDGYYDCGCGTDCDEDGCEGLPIDKPTRMGIGLAVGISIFILAAAMGVLLEKRHNWENEKSDVSDRNDHSRRRGWSAIKGNKIGARYTPTNSRPPSPKVPPCAIQVSEAV